MEAVATVAIQRGHCFRRTGSTGTSGRLPDGRRKTEQEYADALAQQTAREMRRAGHTVHVLTADEAVPRCDVFLAFHQDGSSNSSAGGASIGYPPGNERSARYGSIWKSLYQASHWDRGFRPDNYTSALRGYYGYRRTSAPVKVLMEHGFATNPSEQQLMWTHIHEAARVHAAALQTYLGQPAGAIVTGDDMSNVPSPTLRTGSRGSEVTKLQTLLEAFAAKGTITSPGGVDGIFGSGTERSVISLQRVLKLDADGIYGPVTARALSSFVRFLEGIASTPEPQPKPPATTASKEDWQKADEWLQAGIAALAARLDKIEEALPHAK